APPPSRRQVLALEAPETNQSMFALVARRILELEDAIADRRSRLEHLGGQLPPEPPRLEDVALVLERLPTLGQRLAELPRAELRRDPGVAYDALTDQRSFGAT